MLHKNLKTDISILKFSLLDLNQILKIKLLDFMFQACVCFFKSPYVDMKSCCSVITQFHWNSKTWKSCASYSHAN